MDLIEKKFRIISKKKLINKKPFWLLKVTIIHKTCYKFTVVAWVIGIIIGVGIHHRVRGIHVVGGHVGRVIGISSPHCGGCAVFFRVGVGSSEW